MTVELHIETIFNFTSIVLSGHIGSDIMAYKIGNKNANFFLDGFLILTSLSVLVGELEYRSDADFYNLLFAPLLSP